MNMHWVDATRDRREQERESACTTPAVPPWHGPPGQAESGRQKARRRVQSSNGPRGRPPLLLQRRTRTRATTTMKRATLSICGAVAPFALVAPERHQPVGSTRAACHPRRLCFLRSAASPSFAAWPGFPIPKTRSSCMPASCTTHRRHPHSRPRSRHRAHHP